MDIELRLLDDRLAGWGFPHWGSAGAAGLDLFACLDQPLHLDPLGPAALVPAGFALHIADPCWVGLICPRSGAGHKRGLVLGNAVGVIDADYQGMIQISAWNRNRDQTLTIEPGERIAQMLFTRVERPRFQTVAAFSETAARGAGGFGSTGAGITRPDGLM
jgi:dUTP pyrophosphatase